MHITMPYGAQTVEADLDGVEILGAIDIADAPALPDLADRVRDGFEDPIGLSHSLRDRVKPGESIAIVVSDSFRHTGIEHVLPVLIDALGAYGVGDESIAFHFATGSHRAPNPEEQAHILGAALYERFQARCFNHDPMDDANLVTLGVTSRGTPVRVNKRVQESGCVIVTGAVVLHYFGGFGGGRKSLIPGLAGIDTIAHNHALNLHPSEDRLNPAVRIGGLEGNPVAEDMLEAAQFCKCGLLINTVLNRRGEIAGLFIGELEAAHRQAARFAQDLFVVPISRRADFVIASAGTARNFVQSHKALFNSYQAVRPDGRIIFLAPCPEGFGGSKFDAWVRLGTPGAVIAELRKNAEINGQTALSTLEKARIAVMLTELTDPQATLIGARKTVGLASAIALVRDELRQQGIERPTCWLMPSAAYSVPMPE
jgi:nickel-dependent lactate racemase